MTTTCIGHEAPTCAKCWRVARKPVTLTDVDGATMIICAVHMEGAEETLARIEGELEHLPSHTLPKQWNVVLPPIGRPEAWLFTSWSRQEAEAYAAAIPGAHVEDWLAS